MKRLIYIVLALFSYSAFADRPDNAAPERKPGVHQYKLIMSKEDKVCRYMLGVLNHHVAEGKTRYNELEDSMFAAIQWTRYGISNDNKFNYDAQYAKFDINNDGHEELVVRWRRGSIKLIDVDTLYILPEAVSAESLYRFQELEARSVGGVEIQDSYGLHLLPPLPRENWMKKDKQYFPGLTNFVLMRPFLFASKYYLLLSTSPDVRINPERLVVTRYIGGHVSSADPSKMDDVCYLSRPNIIPR
jgi:hypothetical protein